MRWQFAGRSVLLRAGSIQQLLSESVLVGALAGIAGLLAAAASLQGLVQLLPADTPRLNEISLHWPVFLFAAVASLLTGFLFGLIPALKMASPNLQATLRSSSRGVAGKASQFRVSMALVMGQIGLSVVVITAAGLLLHSLYSLSKVDPGFRTERVVTAEVSLDATACQEKGRCHGFFTTLLNGAQGIAGMESVALTDSLPLSGRDNNYVYDAEGHPRDARQGALLATGRTVSPDYFATLGMRLMRGRMLTDQDESGSSHAVVINQSMAERLWPHQDPLGRHIIDVGDEPTPAVWNKDAASVVVGVVSNTHGGSLAGGFGDEVYLPMTTTREQPVMYVLLRTRASTSEAADELAQGGERNRSAGAGDARPQPERGGGGIGVGSAVAGDSLAVLRRSGAVDRRSGRLQPDRLRGELANAGDRHSAGAGRDAMADRGRDCEAEPAARRRRFCGWIAGGCSADAILAQLPFRGQRARSADLLVRYPL